MKTEIQVFEWEILALIKKQDSTLLFDPSTYVLKYDRARYNQAQNYLIGLKKAELLKQGVSEDSIKLPNQESPRRVPGWCWE